MKLQLNYTYRKTWEMIAMKTTKPTAMRTTKETTNRTCMWTTHQEVNVALRATLKIIQEDIKEGGSRSLVREAKDLLSFEQEKKFENLKSHMI